MDFAALHRLAVAAASDLECDCVLSTIVEGFAADPEIVLARVWLVGPGDLCEDCALADECADRTRCLHLDASAGRSSVDASVEWSRTDGEFQRIPLGARKVGRIARTATPELLDVARDSAWVADPEWIEREGVRCFAGQPLVHGDEVLGVLAVFVRRVLDADEFDWLRTFADLAAIAIYNARAFEEIRGLRARVELERDYLREEAELDRSGILGESHAIRAVLRQIELVAASDSSVLIHGETGTGKELVASAIHRASPRRDAPLVRVNCASTPRELFESEFFGHVRGAFTGATGDRAGRFEVADGGTLFLDEIGEVPLELQGKLLRVLQEGEYSRVGEDTVRSVDVRVVAATNRDLKKEVAEGRFREDLYYRLSVLPIELPPLRERAGDVVLLANHFLRRATMRHGTIGLILRAEDEALLEGYAWPGNVRELENVIERAVILASHGRLHLDLAPAPSDADVRESSEPPVTFDDERRRLERMARDIETALRLAGGRVSGAGGAAERLGIRPTTLASRMKKLGIRRGAWGRGAGA